MKSRTYVAVTLEQLGIGVVRDPDIIETSRASYEDFLRGEGEELSTVMDRIGASRPVAAKRTRSYDSTDLLMFAGVALGIGIGLATRWAGRESVIDIAARAVKEFAECGYTSRTRVAANVDRASNDLLGTDRSTARVEARGFADRSGSLPSLDDSCSRANFRVESPSVSWKA
jgi:hypothetical protein